MVVVKPLLTPADFDRLMAEGEFPEEGTYELVDGEVIHLPPPGWIHGRVVVAIILALGAFAREIGAQLFADNVGFIVGEGHQQVRCPDVSLLVKERLNLLDPAQRLIRGAPDLAVEVLSADQHGEGYAVTKVKEYLGSGGKVVWLADPDSRSLREYLAGKAEYSVYSADAEIRLDSIAPGFAANVGSFFPD